MSSWCIAVAIAFAGCGFAIQPVLGGGDDGIPEGTRITLTDDTADDFAANAGLVDGVIAKRGVIEPAAFVLGGLEAHAFTGNLVADDSTYDSVTATAATFTELGFSYRQVPADWSAIPERRPRGIGIRTTTEYTIFYTGEILLPQGAVTLETDADDRVVIEIALDGTTFGPRLFAHNATVTMPLQVAAAGWYPIRAVLGQAGGTAHWRLEITPLGGAKIPIDGKRLRARVTDGGGLIANAFVGKGLLVAAGETAVATIDEDYGAGPPSHDLPIASTDAFSMRFAGQVHLDAPGMYTFSADVGAEPLDLYRIWIDGALAANYWPPIPDRPKATLSLSEGWHDLLVDYADENLLAKVQLRMSGPDVAEGPIDPKRLRPAVAFGLTAPYFVVANYPLMDAGVINVPLPVVAPGGARIGAVDHGFGIANQPLSDLTVDLLDCQGATPVPVADPARYFYFAHDPSCAGAPVMPFAPWSLRISDTVPGNVGTLTPLLYNPMLVVTYSGGDRMPFAPAFTFVSAPKPTPGAIGYASVTVTADLRGALVMVELRTGADLEALASAPWIPVPEDTVPALTANEWLQYRLAVTSDGWSLASVDKVEITYVVPAE